MSATSLRKIGSVATDSSTRTVKRVDVYPAGNKDALIGGVDFKDATLRVVQDQFVPVGRFGPLTCVLALAIGVQPRPAAGKQCRPILVEKGN